MKKNLQLIMAFLMLIASPALAQPREVMDFTEDTDHYTSFSNLLYFAKGNELWLSDGTPDLTELVHTFTDPIYDIYVSEGALFIFTSPAAGGDYSLHFSDGTSTGTTLIGLFDGIPFDFHITYFNGNHYFSLSTATTGFEVWETDGTLAGTTVLKDIAPGSANASPSAITVFNNALYFIAQESSGPRTLWKSDGTEPGTNLFFDVTFMNTTEESYFLQDLLAQVTGQLILAVIKSTDTDPYTVLQLYSSDGAVASTSMITETGYSEGIRRWNYKVIDNRLYFSMIVGGATDALWITDGTTSGTTELVADLGQDNSISSMMEASNQLIFITNAQNYIRIWRSNGTTSGTYVIRELNAYAADERPMAIDDNYIFFSDHLQTGSVGSGTGINDWELWQTNLTTENEAMVANLTPESETYMETDEITAVNNNIFFEVYDGTDYTLYVYPEPYIAVVTSNISKAEESISVYPNPFENHITVTSALQGNIRVVDMLGQVVYETEAAQPNTTIDLSGLSQGIYHVTTQQSPTSIKVVKK